MTLRERIADWISGGLMSRMYLQTKQSLQEAERCRKLVGIKDQTIANQKIHIAEEADYTKRLFCICRDRANALHQIAAMETPNANATVKRMARTAREAVK